MEAIQQAAQQTAGSITEQQALSFRDDFVKIENEISKAIIGQKELIRNVLVAVVAGGNVLLEGLPGLGKTQLVKAIGKALDMEYSRIQFTPDLMPVDVTGTDIFVRGDSGSSFEFKKGPIFANIVLADEINRATPKTQSALLEAMQEKTVTIGKITHVLPSPFFVLATQNPLELEGTYPLPEAQLDRFIMKLNVEFPDKEQLFNIVELTTGTQMPELTKVCDSEKINELNKISSHVAIAKPVAQYAMELVLKTHAELEGAPEITAKYVRYGASPRGAQAIINVSRIYALLDGRFNVAFEDIKKAAFPTLRHRLFLNFEALAEGISADFILKELF